MTTISAKSILSSMHAVTGDRIDTLLLKYPRWIHAEFMTHRVFSRNAASSRAIPVMRLIEDIVADPAMPLVWTKNQPGMQGYEELEHRERTVCKLAWERAMNAAIREARFQLDFGAHKQIINRILEPYAHIMVVVSSTAWANFLALRDHKDAEPHIRMLARAVREALQGAEIKILPPGDWHLPFVDWRERKNLLVDEAMTLSVARCASTSYKTVEGFDMTLERAQEIVEKLRTSDPIHASPFEHVAQADAWTFEREWSHPDEHRNFTGFRQLRAIIEKEQAE